MNTSDLIELVLPFKAEYVSIARLTASGIANRVGFDIETIEDIKVALAEVCNKLISTGSQMAQSFRIVFMLMEDSLNITFYCEDLSLRCIFSGDNEELGVSIISALMDEVEFCTDNNYVISMTKRMEFEGNECNG